MAAQFFLLFKIFLLSALGSALLKYAIPYTFSLEAIAPSTIAAMFSITLPSLALAGLLWWRSQSSVPG